MIPLPACLSLFFPATKKNHSVYEYYFILSISQLAFRNFRSQAMNPPNPQQQGRISLSQFHANPKLHSEADEQTQIRIEKGLVEELLHTYFSDRRVILDDDPPAIGYQSAGMTNTDVHFLPTANIALYRIEMPDVPPAGAQGSINALHLYVHAGEPYTAEALTRYLGITMKKTDEDGRFYKQGPACAILSWGLKMSFFRYVGGRLEGISLEDVRRARSAGVVASMIAPMD